MADRGRSRSPDRGEPSRNNEKDYALSGGDNNDTATPPNGGGDRGDSTQANSSNGADEVKLYVGNLDYGKQLNLTHSAVLYGFSVLFVFSSF